jgi:PAS domain S-box-containing protein
MIGGAFAVSDARGCALSGAHHDSVHIDSSGTATLEKLPAPEIVRAAPGALAYLLAILLTIVTLALRLWLGDPGGPPLLILFIVPIVVSAYIGGLGPGLVSTALAAFGTDFLVLDPRYSLKISNSASAIGWITLTVVGVLVSVLNEALHRARREERLAAAIGTRALEHKIRASFAIALALLGIISALSFYSVNQSRESAAATRRAETAIDALHSLLETMRDVETSIGRYVITGDPAHLMPRGPILKETDGYLKQLRNMTSGDEAQQRRIDALTGLIGARMNVADQVVALRGSGGFTAGRAAIAGGEGRRLTDEIRSLAREIGEAEDVVAAARNTRAERFAQLANAGIVLGGALAFAFVALALFVIARDFALRRRSNAILRRQAQLLDLARNSIFVNDLDKRILYWNRGAQRLYGWAPEEAVGRKADELLSTRFPVPREEITQQLLEKGYWVGELTHTARDGHTLTVESHWSLRRDENGRPEAVLEINDDITQRKNAEMALHAAYQDLEERVRGRTAELTHSKELLLASEQQFSGIVSSAIDGIVTVDERQRIVLFNIAAEKIFGYTAAEILGQMLDRLIPEAHRSEHKKHVDEFGRTGYTRRAMNGTAIVYGLRANGTAVPLEVSISTAVVMGRKLYTAILRDITERVEAARVQSQLAAIVTSSDDAIIGKSLDGTIMNWNEGACRLFGFSETEAVGRHITLIIPEDRLHEEAMIIEKIARGETVRHFETVRQHQDGTLIDISVTVSPIRDADGRIVGASKVARDITARKRADAELRDRERELRTVTDAIPALIAFVDAEWRFRFANLAYQKWYSMSREEIIGTRLDEVMGHEAYREVAIHFHQALSGQLVSFERVQTQRDGGDGKTRTFHVNYVPSVNSEGAIDGVFIVAHDISDIKRAEDVALRAHKMEALGTLAGGVAHDFNNILPAILGFADVAESAIPEGHPARESLAEIKNAGRRASELVHRILTFSRPQDGAAALIELRPVIDEALKLARIALPPGIELRTDLAKEVPPITVDPTQVYQIVLNFINNAGDAIGGRRGVIDVRLDTLALGVQTHDLTAGNYVRLTVTDDGCGMDRETRQRIFDPFFTTKPPGKGTGLGLSIVNSIVTSLGGAVNVYSETGRGTRFEVYFPVAADVPSTPPANFDDTVRGRGERILYIDDEEPLVFLAGLILKQMGFEVSGFTDAKIALREFRARPLDFDAVVTDATMPGMSGYDVARELTAIRPGLPIIVVSGYVRPEDEARALRAGAREMILKPTDVREMGTAIARLLRPSVDGR